MNEEPETKKQTGDSINQGDRPIPETVAETPQEIPQEPDNFTVPDGNPGDIEQHMQPADISEQGGQDTDSSSLPDATAENSAIVDPPVADSFAAENDPLRQITALREELNDLRASLKEVRADAEEREFRVLYPEIPLSDLPDAVWEDVRRGIPVAAAYALSERRRLLTERKAAECNLQNSRRSTGSLEGAETVFYSPDEVRAMSRSEVRAHYDKILRSMQSWH